MTVITYKNDFFVKISLIILIVWLTFGLLFQSDNRFDITGNEW